MTTAIINTDMNIGPFKIPGNGQNMILNNYAERNKIIVEEIIPEPFMSNALATTQWVHKKKKLKKSYIMFNSSITTETKENRRSYKYNG